METDEVRVYAEMKESLAKIEEYLETDIHNLTRELLSKDAEIRKYKEQLEQVQHSIDGNKQLINKLLGDLSKLYNDLEWYKRTYEQRSFLGTVWEKIFKGRKK